jgi:hypothetical protein
MRKFVRRSALAALLLASFPAAQAAVQNYKLSGTLESGSFIGQTYSGSFSFDDAALASVGEEWLAVSSLSMNIFGTSYTLADAAAPAEVAYLDGNFLGLAFSNATGDPSFSLIAGSSAQSEAFVAYDTTQGLSGTGSLSYAVAAIPEPETYAMLLAGLGLLASWRRVAANKGSRS